MLSRLAQIPISNELQEGLRLFLHPMTFCYLSGGGEVTAVCRMPSEKKMWRLKEVSERLVEEAKEYDLMASKKFVGVLCPILLDVYGNCVDGKRRCQLDRGWPAVVLEYVDTPLKLHVARLVANFCRRRMQPQEVREEMSKIVELSGWSAEKIAEETGISYRTVAKYLPERYRSEHDALESSETEEEALENNLDTLEDEATLEKYREKTILTDFMPSKEDLEMLKRALCIRKGSLQYKKPGDKVYCVTYNAETKKREWRKLGRWRDLKLLIS